MTQRQVLWLRVAVLAVVVVALVLIGRLTSAGDMLSRDALRAAVAHAGPWAVPLFIGSFCLALLLHIPASGIMFVGIAVALYGRLVGAGLAFVGALVGVLVSFLVVRGIAGRPLAEIKHALMHRMLARLEERPVLTVALMRMVFFAGAPLNYALALAPLSARDYLLGSLLGLVLPTAGLAAFFDVLIG